MCIFACLRNLTLKKRSPDRLTGLNVSQVPFSSKVSIEKSYSRERFLDFCRERERGRLLYNFLTFVTAALPRCLQTMRSRSSRSRAFCFWMFFNVRGWPGREGKRNVVKRNQIEALCIQIRTNSRFSFPEKLVFYSFQMFKNRHIQRDFGLNRFFGDF